MSKKGKIVEYLAFRTTTKLLLYCIGLWPIKNPRLIYRFLPYLCFFCSSVAVLAVQRFVYHNITHVAVIVRGMTIGSSLGLSILKIASILMHRKRAIELHETLEQYFNEALNDEQSARQVLVDVTTIRRLCWILIPTIFITVGGYIVRPIASIISQKHQHIEPIEYTLIYPGLYPWKITEGIVYNIHFSVEIIAAITIWCITCGMDALYALYVFQILGQLRLMGYRLKHLNDERHMDRVIKECTRQYAELLKCREILQEIFAPVILWIMLTTAIVLCALIFQVSQQVSSISVGRWIWTLAYLIPKIAQAYIYGWCGSTLTVESENYRSAIYHSNWLNAKKRTMSSIIIVLSQRPLNLTAYKFFIISITMFLMILKTTLSYYFLLRSLDQDS